MSRYIAKNINFINDEIFETMTMTYPDGKVGGTPFLIFLSKKEHINKYLEEFGNELDIKDIIEHKNYLITDSFSRARLCDMCEVFFPEKESQAELITWVLKREYLYKDKMNYIAEKFKENSLILDNITNSYNFSEFMKIQGILSEHEIIAESKKVEIAENIIKTSKSESILNNTYLGQFVEFMKSLSMESKEKIFIALKESGDFTNNLNRGLLEELFVNQGMNTDLLLDEKNNSKLLFEFLYHQESINLIFSEPKYFNIYTKYGENIITHNEWIASMIKNHLNAENINIQDKNNKNFFECLLNSRRNDSPCEIKEDINLFIENGGDLSQINSGGISNLGLLALREPLLTYTMLKSGEIDNNHIELISDLVKNQEIEKNEKGFIDNILKNYVIEKEKKILNESVNSLVEIQEKRTNRI